MKISAGSKKKKLWLIIVLTIFLISFFKISFLVAASEYNLSGWAWSENIGWISFNSLNCSNNDSCPYGVKVNDSILSGYAWSENIGWISFDERDLQDCPSQIFDGGSSQCVAKINWNSSPPKVTGWARALGAVTSTSITGGWTGWIMLGTSTDSGISLVPTTSVSVPDGSYQLRGWGWGGGGDSTSSAVIGWINFNNVIISPTLTQTPPYNLNATFINPCTQSRVPTLKWTLSATGTESEIQIATSSNFANHTIVLTVTSTASAGLNGWAPNCAYCCNHDIYQKIDFNKQYYWRVRVKDQNGSWSNYSSISNFETLDNCYPYVKFYHTPEVIFWGATIRFCAKTEDGKCSGSLSSCYSDDNNCNFEWRILNFSTTTPNPEIEFSTATFGVLQPFSTATVMLTVSDGKGYSCSLPKNISIRGVPLWREIKPSFDFFKKIFASLSNFFKNLHPSF